MVAKLQTVSKNREHPCLPDCPSVCRRSGSEDKSSKEEHLELAFVKLTSPALRCIHLSEKVIKDHLIDR